MKAMLRGTLATLVASLALFATSSAFAEGEACYNDVDCPGTACGDAVCNWSKLSASPMGMKIFFCNPAGSQTPVGKDGWCTVDSDCKCASQGAKCVANYCTFTKPMAGTGGTASTGGTSSTGGTTSSTGGTTPSTGGTASSTGGTTSSTGGTTSSTGGAPVGTTGGVPSSTGGAAASSDDGGGCSVSVPGGANSGLALGVGLFCLGVAFARRRR